jgi:hypothetical protein
MTTKKILLSTATFSLMSAAVAGVSLLLLLVLTLKRQLRHQIRLIPTPAKVVLEGLLKKKENDLKALEKRLGLQ